MPNPSADDLLYLKDLARKSVLGCPSEYVAYGVISEALIIHKTPLKRYNIFPQLFIPWNPNDPADKRGAIPDFCMGRYFDVYPHVRIQGGAEVKAATLVMVGLPPPNLVSQDSEVKLIIHNCQFQAEEQAKSAVKGGQIPNQCLFWLVFVGPYFTILEVGPFTQPQLETRTHKKNDSGDLATFLSITFRKDLEPIERDLFLLGTPEAADRLEWYINTTSAFLPPPTP